MSWKSVLKHPLTSFLTFTFIVTSWPFIGFPLTDGDTAHWVGIATEINKYHNFLLKGKNNDINKYFFSQHT